MGPLWRDFPVSRAFFYIPPGFPNKEGLLIKQKFIFISDSQERSVPLMFFPQRPEEDSFSFPRTNSLFIHSISMNIFMLASVLQRTGYTKLYLIGVLTYDTLVHGKIRECSKDVLIGQLFTQNNTSHDKTE